MLHPIASAFFVAVLGLSGAILSRTVRANAGRIARALWAPYAGPMAPETDEERAAAIVRRTPID